MGSIKLENDNFVTTLWSLVWPMDKVVARVPPLDLPLVALPI